MSEPLGLVSEDELHGYVDQQIDAGRRAVIDGYLREHPEIAQKVAAFGQQRTLLREALSPFAAEPVPPRLGLDRIIDERARRRPPLWRLAATVLLGIALGGAGGWYLHGSLESHRAGPGIALLQQEALANHVVFSVDPRHPIEVGAAEQAHLKEWLSRRLKRVIAPPDLSGLGYKLLGGRLLATAQGQPAALFMYDGPKGARLSVVMLPMAANLNAAMADMMQGKLKGCGWIENGLGYAVVAAVPEGEVERIADRIKIEKN
ncbi:MAG: anti-sigma factor [Alphaproteobacteria bacterium]|nr:anti-sigma factor [Alphaproteobacteria bacterium]